MKVNKARHNRIEFQKLLGRSLDEKLQSAEERLAVLVKIEKKLSKLN